MYLKCNGCNETFFLARSMDHIEWRMWLPKIAQSGADERRILSDRIDEMEKWLSDHGSCITVGPEMGPPPFTISFEQGPVEHNMNVYAIHAIGSTGAGIAIVAAPDEQTAIELAKMIDQTDNEWNIRYDHPIKTTLLPHIKHNGAAMVIEHHESGE